MTNQTLPARDSQPPKVIGWFKVYCGFLCLLYMAVAALSLLFLLPDPADLKMSPVEARLVGMLLLVLGLGFFGVCLLPLIVRPRPWLWVYDLVVICLGMTSACILPASVPLLIFWLRPDVKQHFGKD
jgi:hypothetical protein